MTSRKEPGVRPSPDEDRDYVEDVVARTHEAMRSLRDAHRAMQETVGEGEAADGLILAVADGQGTLRELDFDPRVMRLDVGQLGREVTLAIRTAQDEAAGLAQDLTDEAVARAEAVPAPLDESFVRDRVETATRELLSMPSEDF